MLSLNNVPSGGELNLPGLTLSPVESSQQTTHFDLSLSLSDRGDAIGGALEYASDLFERDTIERLAGHFQQVLSAMVADEQQRVSALPLLSMPQRQQVLVDFNDTAADFPHDQLIHQLFEAQATMQPDAVAVVFEDQQLTYEQLNRHANQLAHHLLALGVQPDDRVAICTERSLDMIVGLLGILKAGGAYVPLDPAYPADRLAYMLGDSAPVALLTQSALVPSLPGLSVPLVVLDADSAGLNLQADSNPALQGLSSRHLAYVIYTSGSTGMPKGVMIEHASAINFMATMSEQPGIGHADTLLAVTTFAFDIAFLELLTPLTVGARVVVLSRDAATDPSRLQHALAHSGATVMQATPVSWRLLLDGGWQPAPGFKALCGGEALGSGLALRLAELLSGAAGALWNLYGPTETTIWSARHELTNVGSHAGSTASLGRPVANTQIYVLDRHLQPVPLGVAGELYIGGAGVARGYLNRAALTAERFVSNPFGAGRLYRTGDLGCWLDDGTLSYLGRNDFQVKVRGFRIELGEIEARLAACAGVREAVVVAREDGARESAHGDKRLVAYLVAQDGVTLDASALRTALAAVLADYMIPSAFVTLDSLPLTANGKLDRRALPAPDQGALAIREYVEPVGAAEQALAAIWQELLGVPRVGRHDHFFELGGHSLLAVQLVSRVRQTLGDELPLREVFTQPTLAELATVLGGAARADLPPILPADRNADLPLSWAQQRLWFLDQLDHAAGAAYHLPAALRLHGALDRDALCATLDRIVARHEGLRTTFANGPDGPVQVIAPADCGFTLTEHALRELHQLQREQALAQLSAAEASTPFDLAAGPLVRGQLIHLADDEHILLVTQHHVISDGWSMGILVKEVSALYTAFCQGQPDPLPPLTIQYADYAAWQRQWLQGDTLQQQIEFWRTHLEGAPALLELPADRPRPAVQSHAGDRVALTIPAELAAGLRGLAQRHGATLFMTLLSGWAVLLARMSGQEDVVIGTPVANRQRSEVEAMIGFFVNTLALRVRLGEDPSVAQLLDQVKASTVAAYDHQDLPFEQVVEALRPPRSMSYSPIFQVMLSLNNVPSGGELNLPGLTLSPVESSQQTTHFDLSLSLSDRGDAIGGTLEYASDLFERSTIERLAGHFRQVLAAMVADEQQRISALPLLNAPQRRQLLVDFNDTAADFPHGRLIHQLFEAQADIQPDAIALIYEDQQLTYEQLNRRANQLAHHLLALGVQPDDRVAICTERSLDMIVGLLGILKAGCAYVPLDPAYPADRLAYMLGDSAPVALLTQSALVPSLPGLSVPLVVLDADSAGLNLQADSNPALQGLSSRHLAYVIYTSGSTGMPKGVMIEHASATNFMATMTERPGIGHTDTVLAVTTFAFDIAFLELLGPLMVGARVVVLSRDAATDPARLQHALAHSGATVMQATPVSWRLLLDGGWQPSPGFKALCGGEALGSGLALRLAELLSGAAGALWNLYGPTETTIWSARHELTNVGSHAGSTASLGRPVANTQIYVLDRHLQPVPMGVAGELYIGGAGVARGYLNRAELTAERFVPDPFSAEPDARMYKTGDLGRWLADGNLDYLGRNDFQVKVRGFRIELGEIEARLAACGGVREAVVLAREDGARESAHGDKRLVAYLVAQDGVTLDAAALRTTLTGALPDYMMPSAFVTLDSLPLTANGKLDRRALPAPDQGALAIREYVEPVGAAEQALAAIWQELLGVPRIGRHDHFFELGGHSLLAVQLVSRVRQTLGDELPLREVFTQPTLAELATVLGGAARADLPPILPADRNADLPLSWAQQRLWFLDQLDHAAGAAYHLPAALRLHGALDRDALCATLDRIVARHEGLRTTFANGPDGPVQVIAPADCGFTLTEHDLRELHQLQREQALTQLSAAEASTPFDLAAGPLIRGQLIRLADDEHILLVTQHHVISDGWSMGILVKEVSTLYTAFCQGQPDPLPPLTIQYADYAAWQRQWLQGETLQQQVEFWRTHLEGAPALLELPADRPRPAVQSHAGDRVALTIPAELATGLRGLAQRHGATLFMTLFSGWAILLARMSGQDDVVIGTPVANRQRSEVEAMIGFFVNTLALRVRLGEDPSVAQLLDQVKASTVAAYGHQDLPFEQVVEALRPPRSMSYSPIFQVMLSLNNVPSGGELSLPGLTLSPVESSQQTTHFDLSLSLSDRGDTIGGTLEYASDLFERSTIERLAGHFQQVLAAMVADEQQRVSALPLLNAPQRQQVLVDFNDTAAPYPQDRFIHQLFEAQTAARPDAVAVVFEDQQLTYDQLNCRANQLAHHLRALGVKPDALVAICVERGVAMVVAMLATLKAGGAYLPLDPAYPTERLAYMLEDSAPFALLADADSLARLGASDPAMQVVALDAHDAAWRAQPTHKLALADVGLTPEHLAYVIYTSGSTGQPKGVMLTHRGLPNMVMAQVKAFGVSADSRILQFASFSFDACTFEWVMALCTGAALYLARRATLLEADTLARFVAEHGISHATLPPALVATLPEHVTLPSVQTLILAGEAPSESVILRWSADRKLVNAYGPTETTVWASAFVCGAETGGTAPIGRPIENTRIYLLDSRLEPVPVGVTGEIYIGGPGIARGYLHRPDLTAERFIPDPFGHVPGARLYKTGDLGRWLPDGSIDYLGRNDFQVKVRGFRIELGEIEACLAACAGVREAVVVAREDGARESAHGDKRLVAYVVGEVEVDALRTHVAASLPEYMVPGAFVVLDRMPLTPNGKFDRQALPAPESGAFVSREYAAPQGETEVALAAIWSELLGRDQVGRHDHFFELGGHSLLAVQMVSRLRQRLGVELPLRALFARPTLEGLAGAVDQAAQSTLSAIAPADRTASLPLSWAQQRLWFLDQLDHAASAAYHIPAALRLRGALDRDALRATLDRIVTRHEGLRTTFASGPDGPIQVIAPADCGFVLAEHDLGALASSEREQALARLRAAETSAPFDLAAGPLVRGRLIRLADDEHILLVTQHHVISDGWSMGILVKEVSALYTAFSQGQPDPLPPLAIQYADYAAWQRQWLQGDALNQQVEFWRTHLEGAPALLELPADRPRPAVQSHAGDRVALTIPAELATGLRGLAQRHGATLFMTLLSGWSILLARMSGQDDVVIGTPVANRQRTEIEALIGFFVNTLALRVQLGEDPSVAQLLAKVKASTVAAYDHQDLPFEQVVEALRPPRSMSYSPIFQVMLSLNNVPTGGELSLPGLILSPVESSQQTTHFDLSLSLSDRGDAIAGTLEYASDLFERSTIERLAGHFQHVLAAMVADEQQRVSALPLLTAPQRQQLLVDFNDTAAPYPQDRLVHELFEAHAAARPDAIALVYRDQQLTYDRLNRRANQLAHHLRALGVKPDTLVAICVERGVEMVVAMLATLKVGGAYVPLDPAYPADRLAHMLADSGPAAILAHGPTRQLVASLAMAECPLVDLDARQADWSAQSAANLDAAETGLLPEHLAYIIYTSGSTGEPKGVMNTHRGLCNLTWGLITAVDVRPESRVLQFVSLSFDVCISEIVMALCRGACLHLSEPDGLLPGEPLLATLKRHRISHVSLPMAVLATLPYDAELDDLRTLIVGGEAMPRVLADRWAARYQLFNAYGPTETTVCATLHRCVAGASGAVALGRPIANTKVYILDDQLQPVPIGVTGELYIGGAGVARGYLNRPELTAERFLRDPFSADPDAGMYKTGDLGRWLADGNIEYLGRNDFQVKLRGFRIELGEIEARLAACAGVREAVVLAREDGARESAHGDKRLVAYLVAQDGVTLDAAALRTALAAVLADYMMPSAFVTLDSLPLTANGKLDRRALPAPDHSARVTRAYAAPIGATEAALAAIWQELLGVERIGRHDHFFELGGHSLLAVQMVSRLRQRLDVELPLREVFSQPTLEGLAAIVDQAGQSTLSAIPPADRSASLPLSWAQQRLWFLDRLDHAASAAYHLPAALRLRGSLDRSALRATLDRIVARHEGLRTTFANSADGPVQVIAPADCGFALAEHDLRELDQSQREQALAQLSAAEASTPFDLAADPLIRGQLIRLADDEHILLVTQHHIISDGWSVAILVKEVSALYAAFCQGQADPLPPLAIQYADYAAWQRQWLQGDALQQQVEFWRTHLEGAPALLELPADRPRPAVQSHAGDSVAFTIPAELAAGLRSLAQRHGATLFMTLLSGWSILLSRLSGQDDVVVGTPVANRQRSEIEALIGFFVNTLALRVQLDEDPSVAQLLAKVKASTVAAYDHQDVPFEQVVEALRPPRSMSYSPIFQVMLSLNNLPTGGELSLPGLTLSPVESSQQTSHFDLSLSLTDRGDAIGGTLEYASDLFERSTIERLAGHFQQVLAAMVADEQQRVSALPLLTAPQRQQLLVDFNDTAAPYPHDQLIHQLFEAQAAIQPDAIALVVEEQQLSYGQLNRRANQLAHHLLALGVQPDDRVAICAERSLELIVGLIGILKAGAAYVPLDPSYPAERLAYMLGDSTPVALLTQSGLVPSLPALTLPLVLLDADNGPLNQQADSNPVPQGLTSSHLAYVTYTSGSTGMPKGVMIAHHNVIQLVINEPCVEISPQDRMAYCANPAFDASTWEIWGALLNGAAVVIIPQAVLLEPADFARMLQDRRVTILQLTAGLFREYADRLAPVFGRLQYLLFGGDQSDIRTVRKVFTQSPPAHLVHTYGPTETTTFTTTHEVSDALIGATALPIGRPIANTQVYILDAHLQPVPLGVTGELYIGGAGVARGYLNLPELSAERFLADPFSSAANARMYKTGDLGRWLPDGSIEYLGRNDFQVKIRGFRIELGEIEARLAGCVGVREAVVLARKDVPGDKRLVAYLVAQDGVTLDAAALRTALAGVLADYMIPSAFVILDSLPLTANGKLDRRALPAPDQDALLTRLYEAPVGAIETALAAIWQELLGVERVGRHDHFFELGGHSLMVISMIERLRQRDLFAEVRTVFNASTLAAMASAMQTSKHETAIVPPNLIGPDCTAITPDMLPLVELTQAEIDSITLSVPGGAANIQDIYPLAPLQEGILFHHMLESEGDTYLLRHSFFFAGRAQLDAFLGALQTVIDRHDILRTGIHWDGLSQPVQVVERQARLPIHTNALDGEGDTVEQLQTLTDPRHVRLDLKRAPLLAAHIAPDPHSAQWMMVLLNHHIVSDHVTVDLIVEEINAILQGQDADLAPPLPYRNFISQARAISVLEHETYFRRQLGDIDEPTAPFGVIDLLSTADDVAEASLMLTDDLAQGIRERARGLGVTAAVLFHAAWALVLNKCTGQDDVVFGTILSGRMQGTQGADRVLGMFINTLPVRISLGERSVHEVVLDTYQRLSELLVHEQASLALAQRCSSVPAPMPLFTALLNYRHSKLGSAPTDGGASDGVRGGMRSMGSRERTNYPLTLAVDDLGSGFCLTAHCAPGIDPKRVNGYLNSAMEALVNALTTSPERLIHTLAILPAGEGQQLASFNDTAADFPHDQLIHRLFEAQAAAQPDAVAVVYQDQQLNYGQLNRRANQLAHYLLALGVQPDDRVAICAGRSLDMIVGLLGILKAGAAYVPLDPGYPAERLAYMLDDSAPVALVSTAALAASLPALSLPLVALDADSAVLGRQPDNNPDPAQQGLTSHHLANVIYTSGSTGMPKGVMVEHRNVLRLVINNHYVRITPDDCVVHCANPAFDASTWEIWGALLNGARLLVIAQPVLLDPIALRDTLEAHPVSILHLTVGLFNQYTEVLVRLIPKLEYLLFGGEQADIKAVERVLVNNRPRHLVHCYGPTETTTFATTFEIGHMAPGSHSLPIGRPIANTQVYILDAHLQPVPLGVTGELYIGGAGVARGYLNRPELSAERFLADPFSSTANARMYKTGDLGRWLPDGTIEYQGRNDFQVKIRGFRIELGEIEARLAACAGVREAVVLAREDGARESAHGDKRLVAYMVAEDGVTLDAAALRTALAAVLADYMMPSAFVILDSLPLTANGKLDRRALPAPDQSVLAIREYVEPIGATEQALAAIWQELLGVPRVGRHDHFFELGGHSLLAVQLLLRMRQTYEIEVSLKDLFNKPILWELADLATSLQLQFYLEEDVADIDDDLESLSESELLAILSKGEAIE
jgi:amino acid adenylation domain-containing protein